MEISSEEENSSDQFIMSNQNLESHKFLKAYSKNFYNKESYFEEDNEYIKSEFIYFNSQEGKDIFTEKKEEPIFIISSDNKKIENSSTTCPKQNDFKLFNKCSSNYNNLEKYSQKCIYELNSGPRKRVDMADIKRKKIYTNIYRNIFKNLNKKISTYLGDKLGLKFCNLSQCIIANVAKSENKTRMTMTLRELILDESYKKVSNKKDKDSTSWDNNKKILDYLDTNKDCSEIKNILEMKLKDIYNEYLQSDEFQKSIQELVQDGRYYGYIHDYIEVAKNFVEYYS